MSGRLEKREIAGLSSVSCKHRTKNYELRTSIFLLFSLLLTLHFSGCATKQGIVKTESGLVSNATKAVPSNQKDNVTSAQTNDIFMETIRSNVPIFVKPDSDKIVATMSLGDVVKVQGTNAGFIRILWVDGIQGWVSSSNMQQSKCKVVVKKTSSFVILKDSLDEEFNCIGNIYPVSIKLKMDENLVRYLQVETYDEKGMLYNYIVVKTNFEKKAVLFAGPSPNNILGYQRQWLVYLKTSKIGMGNRLDRKKRYEVETGCDETKYRRLCYYLNEDTQTLGISFASNSYDNIQHAQIFKEGRLVKKYEVKGDNIFIRVLSTNRIGIFKGTKWDPNLEFKIIDLNNKIIASNIDKNKFISLECFGDYFYIYSGNYLTIYNCNGDKIVKCFMDKAGNNFLTQYDKINNIVYLAVDSRLIIVDLSTKKELINKSYSKEQFSNVYISFINPSISNPKYCVFGIKSLNPKSSRFQSQANPFDDIYIINKEGKEIFYKHIPGLHVIFLSQLSGDFLSFFQGGVVTRFKLDFLL